MFVLWYQHAKRLEKRVARIGSRTPQGSHLVNSSLSSLLLLKCPSYCNLPGICHNLAWWNLPYERDKTTTTKNIFHTTFKHHYISFLWTFHLFSFPYGAHPYIQNSILHTTCQEEHISLSTEIKNHYFDSFTNSYVTLSVEDKLQDAVPWWSELQSLCTCKHIELTFSVESSFSKIVNNQPQWYPSCNCKRVLGNDTQLQEKAENADRNWKKGGEVLCRRKR